MVVIRAVKTAVNLSAMSSLRQCCCCFTPTGILEELCGPALNVYWLICNFQDVKNGNAGIITCLECREFLEEIHRFRIEDVEVDAASHSNPDIKPSKDELTRNDAIEGNSSIIYLKTEPIDEYEKVNQIDIQINEVEVDSDAKEFQINCTERIFKCDRCAFECNENKNMIIHKNIHSKMASIDSLLKTKIGEYSHNQVFYCDDCKFNTHWRSSMSDHVKKHLGYKPYKCNECSYASINAYRLKKHIEFKHSNETPCSSQRMIPKEVGMKETYKSKNQSKSKIVKRLCKQRPNIHPTERLFKCDKCAFECNEKQNMVIHKTMHSKIESIDKNDDKRMRKHKDNEILYCDTCSFNTHRKSNLKNHLKIHLEYKPYKCSDCSYASITPYSLSRHIKRKHSDAILFPKTLNTHMIRSDERLFYCSYCTFSNKSKQYLGIHMKKHLGYKPYKCSECSYATITAEYLKKHITFKHSDERPFSCDQCDYSAKTKYLLIAHKVKHSKVPIENSDSNKHPFTTTLNSRMKYSVQGPFYCDHCAYSTERKQRISIHVIKHLNYKPYKCTKCSYATTAVEYLRKHITHKHNDERPFSCDKCNHTSKSKSNLNAHKITHLKESNKNHKSKKCSRTTMSNSHMKKQSRLLPYKCTECSYKAHSLPDLKTHVSLFHPVTSTEIDYSWKPQHDLKTYEKKKKPQKATTSTNPQI